MVYCKGHCGGIFIPDVVSDYKEEYCKDCYILKLEKELEEIKKIWIKSVPIYQMFHGEQEENGVAIVARQCRGDCNCILTRKDPDDPYFGERLER